MSDLVFEDHFTLFHLFHGYNIACSLDSANTNLAKGTTSNNRQRLKVTDCDLLSPGVNIQTRLG